MTSVWQTKLQRVIAMDTTEAVFYSTQTRQYRGQLSAPFRDSERDVSTYH